MKWFLKLFSYFKGRAADDVARALEISKSALPIVQLIAALTPTRMDDEIIALFQRFAVPNVEAWLRLPMEERGRALMQVAALELKRRTPEATGRIIDLAIQFAVVQMRSQEGAK